MFHLPGFHFGHPMCVSVRFALTCTNDKAHQDSNQAVLNMLRFPPFSRSQAEPRMPACTVRFPTTESHSYLSPEPVTPTCLLSGRGGKESLGPIVRKARAPFAKVRGYWPQSVPSRKRLSSVQNMSPPQRDAPALPGSCSSTSAGRSVACKNCTR